MNSVLVGIPTDPELKAYMSKLGITWPTKGLTPSRPRGKMHAPLSQRMMSFRKCLWISAKMQKSAMALQNPVCHTLTQMEQSTTEVQRQILPRASQPVLPLPRSPLFHICSDPVHKP